MTYIKMSPWKNFEKAARRMTEFAGELEKGLTFETGNFSPRTDISEDDKGYFMHLELPGIKKEEVKITVTEDKELTIQGEKQATMNDNKSMLKSERVYGKFSRTFILPDNVDYQKIAAKFENGILELSMPKIEPPLPKEYEINID